MLAPQHIGTESWRPAHTGADQVNVHGLPGCGGRRESGRSRRQRNPQRSAEQHTKTKTQGEGRRRARIPLPQCAEETMTAETPGTTPISKHKRRGWAILLAQGISELGFDSRLGAPNPTRACDPHRGGVNPTGHLLGQPIHACFRAGGSCEDCARCTDKEQAKEIEVPHKRPRQSCEHCTHVSPPEHANVEAFWERIQLTRTGVHGAQHRSRVASQPPSRSVGVSKRSWEDRKGSSRRRSARVGSQKLSGC